MDHAVAKFMMGQIDERVAKRKRPLDKVLAWKLDRVREIVTAGKEMTAAQAELLLKNYERFSDPDRMKWGAHVRIP